MIATSGLIILSIWALVIASLTASGHRVWQDHRILKLERRVHELEMDRDYPGWREHFSDH